MAGNQCEPSAEFRTTCVTRWTFFLTCTWVCMGLDGTTVRARNASSCLLANFRDFEPREHVRRTLARDHTCAVVFGRAPCVPRSREQEKRPASRRNMPMRKKNTCIYIVVYIIAHTGSPELRSFGWILRDGKTKEHIFFLFASL